MNWRPFCETPPTDEPLSALVAFRDPDMGELHLLGIWEWTGAEWRDEEGWLRSCDRGAKWWCPEAEVIETMQVTA